MAELRGISISRRDLDNGLDGGLGKSRSLVTLATALF